MGPTYQLWLAVALISSTTAQPPPSTTTTYPTTIITTLTTTYTNPSTPSATTIDHITLLDPWPVSPDFESIFPYPLTQTEILSRTIIHSPSSTSISPPTSTTLTWSLWAVQAFDMSPYVPPICPGPEGEEGCAYGSIKPHYRCEELGLETRCARQCELKDWIWWCRLPRNDGKDSLGGGLGGAPVGRVCADRVDGRGGEGGGGGLAWVPLVEPCDHTDFKVGCKVCREEEEEEGRVEWRG
ncbi:hypothetical protein QC761_0102170 [Podospora bellae-mahoneyi]|uniref:Uncharacterized protein n=1 Tax=Podospora bellae-mahoneyi TaxID=2093777 RepID=A0ABR0F4T7_9PEZI|nr:hypothetical protein QC761_0102170 [Podospora bellae-mahoneyi]